MATQVLRLLLYFQLSGHAIWPNRGFIRTFYMKIYSSGTFSPLIAAGVISLFIILLRSYADILFLSVVSVPIFATVLYITGWIDSDDKKIFLKLIPGNRV